MYLNDLSRVYQKAWATNADTATFASRIPTVTEPTNDGVVALHGSGIEVPRQMIVLPYGLGADDDSADMRIIGWRSIGYQSGGKILWVPAIMGIFTVTIGTTVGIAASPVLNTERFADTITLKSDNTTSQPVAQGIAIAGVESMGRNIDIFSPSANLIAWIKMDLLGMEKVEFIFDQITNSPTMNALIAFL